MEGNVPKAKMVPQHMGKKVGIDHITLVIIFIFLTPPYGSPDSYHPNQHSYAG